MIGVLLILGVLLFMKMSKGSDAEPATPPPANHRGHGHRNRAGAVSADGAPAPADSPPAAAARRPSPPRRPAPTASSGTVSPEALVPGPGLPRRGRPAPGSAATPSSLSDRRARLDRRRPRARTSVGAISRGSGVSPSSCAPASKVAALFPDHPGRRRRAGCRPSIVRCDPTGKDGGPTAPQATVSYGFRDSLSVRAGRRQTPSTTGATTTCPYHPGLRSHSGTRGAARLPASGPRACRRSRAGSRPPSGPHRSRPVPPARCRPARRPGPPA